MLISSMMPSVGWSSAFSLLMSELSRSSSADRPASLSEASRERAKAELSDRVMDTYGGVGHIGGGAMSGKDPSKVDRSGAYMARKNARDIVRAGFAEKCEVQIAYAIGVAEPVSIHVDCFGTESQELDFIEDYVRGNYDLTPRGIIGSLNLLSVDYNKVSVGGHFGRAGLPWEE